MNIQSDKSNLGRIEISPDVIEVIASIAVTETQGVHSLQNNFASGNLEKLGKKFRGHGIKVDMDERDAVISIYVVLNTDKNVHKVAENIQGNVKQTINTMLETGVSEVNVHIVNIVK